MSHFLDRVLPKQGKSSLDSPGPIHKLFTREPHNFRYVPHATLIVESPECGPSNVLGNLTERQSASGDNAFPHLTWRAGSPEEEEIISKRTKEYFIIVEDLDGTLPLSTPPVHGMYYGIPPTITSVQSSDFTKLKKGRFERVMAAQRGVTGGFKYAPVAGNVWNGPKNHRGLHRYHFQVIALSAPVNKGDLSEYPTKQSFRGATEGKVVGWGEWVGVYGRA